MGQKLKRRGSWLSVHWPIVILGFGAAALLSGMGYVMSHVAPSKPETDTAGVPLYYSGAEDAMPFPTTLDSGSFKNADVRDANQTAKDIPGVLAQQPCYCYWQRKGHRSLLDCFRTDHAV